MILGCPSPKFCFSWSHAAPTQYKGVGPSRVWVGGAGLAVSGFIQSGFIRFLNKTRVPG